MTDKPADKNKRFPLPPLDSQAGKSSLLKPFRSLSRAARVPGKVMERVNQELYKRNAELAVRNKTLALLRKLDEISLAALGLHEIAEKMVTAIGTELGYEIVSLAVVDTEKQRLKWLAVFSSVSVLQDKFKEVPKSRLFASLEDNLLSIHALKQKHPHTVSDPRSVFPEALQKILESAQTIEGVPSIHSTIIFPLTFGHDVLGILTLSASRDLKNLTRYEHESNEGILGLVALALYKAKIYEDLQKTSKELVIANEQLKNLDKAKSEFLSIASHQLYTPLTALRGYLSMLEEGDYGPLVEKQKPIVDILQKSTERLIILIKDLLDISRIESGRLELKLESVDLVEMAKVLVQDLLPNAMNKGLHLTFLQPSTSLPHVVADSQRIRQVMLNFIDNAIKYTIHGKVEVGCKLEQENFVFFVNDTGKGLLPEETARLFVKFTRVGESNRYNTEGVGLGLYVAKQIVKEHRGDITVESPGVDKGSTFSMRLPIEGSTGSLKLGDKATVIIKAAEATQ